ncbi:hypothetical protein C8J56DRAFT_898984 [Mycena floridula]|nr:hypothetical protein C8J56DRAFT_898984 [Mycena floridula]
MNGPGGCSSTSQEDIVDKIRSLRTGKSEPEFGGCDPAHVLLLATTNRRELAVPIVVHRAHGLPFLDRALPMRHFSRSRTFVGPPDWTEMPLSVVEIRPDLYQTLLNLSPSPLEGPFIRWDGTGYIGLGSRTGTYQWTWYLSGSTGIDQNRLTSHWAIPIAGRFRDMGAVTNQIDLGNSGAIWKAEYYVIQEMVSLKGCGLHTNPNGRRVIGVGGNTRGPVI